MTNKYLFTNNQLKTAIIYYIENNTESNNTESNNIWNQIKKNVENPSFTTFLFYLYKLKQQNKYNIEIPKININANFYNKLIKILLDNQEKISDIFPLTNQPIIEIINNYDIKIKNLMKLLNKNNIVITLSKIKNINKKNLIKVLYLKNEIQELKIDLFNLFSFFVAYLVAFIFLFLLYIVISIY